MMLREVIKDASVVARDVNAATEAREIDVDNGFICVAAENYRVCLHVIFEILALEFSESGFQIAVGAVGFHGGDGHRRMRDKK